MKVQRVDRNGNLRNSPFDMDEVVFQRLDSRTKGKHNLVVVRERPRLKKKLPK